MDFSLVMPEEKSFLVDFVAVLMEMGTFSGSALTLHLFKLVNVDKSNRPRCLPWHGKLPALACPDGGSAWADSAGDVGLHRLDCALVAYSDDVCREWVATDRFRAELAASRISDEPDVWTDGSFVGDALWGWCWWVVSMLIGLGLVGFKGGGCIWTCFLLMVR